jgi:hypothetical protein
MKGITLVLAGLVLGLLCIRRRRPAFADLRLEIEELATPSLFRRTLKIDYRPVRPVSKGVAPPPA